MDTSIKQTRRINPLDKANPFSLLSFAYTLGLFRRGFKKDLEDDDIYEVVKECKSKELGDETEIRWARTTSVLKLLLYQFGMQYLMISIINIAWAEATSILQPLGQSRLISYFTSNHNHITKSQAYQYAGVVVFLKVGNCLIINNCMAYQIRVGLRMHASLKSLLYRKALKLSPSSSGGTNLGNLITLITKDIFFIENNIWILKELTVIFIQFFTSAYLLYNRMGVTAFIGLSCMFISLPLQGFLSVKLKNMRRRVQANSDERLQRTQETLSCMKIIKIYTWENFFCTRIAESRKKEMRNMVQVYFVNMFNTILGVFVSKSTFCILVLIYIQMGYKTSTELIFYVNTLFTQLQQHFGVALPMSFSKIAQLYVALQRLDKVLGAGELEQIDEVMSESPSVVLKNTSFAVNNKEILEGVSINVTSPELTVVTGPVGSGKSSLLKVILRNYQPLTEGTLEVNGTISYASQDPWLFPASIRQNILFGEEYDEERYNQVVKVCALKYDFSLFDDGDQTILADRGMNLSKGQQARINLARAVYRDADVYLFDDSLTALDNNVQDYIFRECLSKFLEDRIRILVSQNPEHMKKADRIIVLKEGKMVINGDSKNIDNEVMKSITGVAHNEKKMSVRPSEKKASLFKTEQQQTKKDVYKEVKKVGKVDINIYGKYFRFGGGLIIFGGILLIFVASQFVESYADKMLTKWVDYQQTVIDLEHNATTNGTKYDQAVADKNHTFMLYGILTAARCVVALIRFYCLLWFCQRASVNLHEAMVKGLSGATMSFFDNHFIGNILNRFSYDMNNIDEFIPFLFPGLGSTIFQAGGALILITSVNWFFIIPAIVFLLLLIGIRWLFIPTARSLKRLEAACRSPLVGHINSSLEGLTTIRAYKAEQILKDEFDRHQDLYTSAFMTLRISMASVGFFMDIFVALFTFVVIARFLFFDMGTSAGNVGLALTQVFQLTSSIDFAIRMWTDLENSMTSVERAAEYTTVKQERQEGAIIEDWPTKGAIKFEKVDLCYEGSRTSVLKGISFDVQPREKIGIVGRTGAGKSSILTTLFRLYDFDGRIEIDGIDTKTVALQYLRRNISIIPQDPVLFTGSMRENIDPFNKYTDEVIWEVINRVGIKEMVPTLETYIESGGSKYSSGQKQLVCLARAAISKCKIVVLDEATANMDAETDKMLNQVVDEIFDDCTILTIAHRLHSIMKCDKVLVLDSGNIAEYGSPIILKDKEGGLFHKMCKESKMD